MTVASETGVRSLFVTKSRESYVFNLCNKSKQTYVIDVLSYVS